MWAGKGKCRDEKMTNPAVPEASSLRLGVDAPKPHEQGAWVLRFVPNGAVVGVDGGKPTSRGLPPAAVLGEGTGSLMGFVGGKHRGSIERPDRETAGVRLGRSRGGLWEPRGKPLRKPANFHDIACPCGTSNIALALKMPASSLSLPRFSFHRLAARLSSLFTSRCTAFARRGRSPARTARLPFPLTDRPQRPLWARLPQAGKALRIL